MPKSLRLAQILLLSTAAIPCWAAPACGTSTDPAAVVQAQVDAYNKHDVEAFLTCYANNATVYWLDGKKVPAKGIEALRTEFAFLGKIPPAGAGFGVDIVAKTVTGPTIANVEHMRGLPPNAPPVPDTLVLYEVRDGKIQNVWFAPAK
jgi:putative hydrolase of HD superfamily